MMPNVSAETYPEDCNTVIRVEVGLSLLKTSSTGWKLHKDFLLVRTVFILIVA